MRIVREDNEGPPLVRLSSLNCGELFRCNSDHAIYMVLKPGPLHVYVMGFTDEQPYPAKQTWPGDNQVLRVRITEIRYTECT